MSQIMLPRMYDTGGDDLRARIGESVGRNRNRELFALGDQDDEGVKERRRQDAKRKSPAA